MQRTGQPSRRALEAEPSTNRSELGDAGDAHDHLANRMQLLSRLYPSLSHEIKGPLNALTLNLDLLADSVAALEADDEAPAEAGPADLRRYVGSLQSDLGRLVRSLQTLLTQSAPPQAAPARFDLVAAVREVVDLVEPAARERGARVELQDMPEPVWVVARRDGVSQAMLNVVLGALTRAGGEADAHTRTDVSTVVGVALGVDGEAAKLSVTYTASAAEPLHGPHQGDGIGISAARACARAAGARVDVNGAVSAVLGSDAGREPVVRATLSMPLARRGEAGS